MFTAEFRSVQRMLGIGLVALLAAAGSGAAQPASEWTFFGQVVPHQTVEAEGGTVLLELVQLDPVLVSYAVPYEVRQKAMARAGVRTVADLLKRLRLSIQLPSGQEYGESGRALFESTSLEPATKALKVWGEFPNADRILGPGLQVRLRSRLHDDGKVGSQ